MKATGIVRRIDNLGRVVIPKEIRKHLRIKSGDNIEIFINEEENIILKKYSQISKLEVLSQTIVDAINSVIKKDVILINTSEVIAGTGIYKKKYLNKPISNQLNQILKERTSDIANTPEKIYLTEIQENLAYAYFPIIAEGDIYGLLIVVNPDIITEEDFQSIKIGANFLAKYIEE